MQNVKDAKNATLAFKVEIFLHGPIITQTHCRVATGQAEKFS